MSLFQCQWCGRVENTALSSQGYVGIVQNCFNWTEYEQRKGLKLCSHCGPFMYTNGRYVFRKEELSLIYLPMGQFETDNQGNLFHTESQSTDVMKYRLEPEVAFSMNENVKEVKGKAPFLYVVYKDGIVVNLTLKPDEYNFTCSPS